MPPMRVFQSRRQVGVAIFGAVVVVAGELQAEFGRLFNVAGQLKAELVDADDGEGTGVDAAGPHRPADLAKQGMRGDGEQRRENQPEGEKRARKLHQSSRGKAEGGQDGERRTPAQQRAKNLPLGGGPAQERYMPLNSATR